MGTVKYVRTLLLGPALCWLSLAVCQAAAPHTDDVTVLLFRTESVQQLQVRFSHGTYRVCEACAEQRGPVNLEIQRHGSAMIDATGRAMHSLRLLGAAEVVTGGRKQARAAGEWRIGVEGDHLLVSLRTPRERYVEAVLTAEAETDAPPESLKALAVAVRSFAAAAGSTRHQDGALCDTTHCQALRFASIAPSIREAVWSTSGETLWFGARQVPAYFSQACGGFTEDASVEWGGPVQPWLVAHADPWCSRYPAQWRAAVSEQDVRAALVAEGLSADQPIQDIAADARDRSGRIQQVRFETAAMQKTIPASTFRFALNRSLGWNQIRSDRYQVRHVGNAFVFDGTGFGHGVGLCQAGASAMARSGKGYRDILRTYFPGTAVRIRRQDAGWVTVPLNGFTVRTTDGDAGLRDQASRAFSDARARWGRPVQANTTLTVFPSTELFRQATGQPGWDLAVTQGSRIATQPVPLLRANGGAGPLFRHEFLHSFVEATSSPAAPLWLREGLVSALNGEQCTTMGTIPVDQVNAALIGATSRDQSQRAHAEACALAKQYVAQHGLSGAQDLLQRR